MSEITTDNIAETFKIGNTTIEVVTDICDKKTPEEVQAILNRIAEIVEPAFA